ncbi:OadG family protein [Fusobacterium sp. IOR10]|uniref:OadG family protein n=1 Tax=Fusobacterium sp. IOR10 TaxID=2665157 RepID=UPI0013D83711|nr:OadG family protein [Fusobacterium sp. IOR10]
MMEKISMMTGIQLSIMSMLIVFVLLYIISLILESFKVIFKEGKEQKKPDVIVKPQVKNEIKTETVIVSKKGITFEELESDQDMLMAAMVASMEASGENKESNYKIVSIKQL